MKAVTSSIALVALVAFEGLLGLPSFSSGTSGNLYLDLNAYLDDGEHPQNFCSADVLTSLKLLMKKALVYEEILTGQHKDASRLNSIIAKLKDSARAKCYQFLQSQWEVYNSANNLGPAAPNVTLEIGYINSNVSFDALLKRFIYLSKSSEDITYKDKAKLLEIIVGALLAGQEIREDKPLSSPNLTNKTLRNYHKKHLRDPCSELIQSEVAIEVLRPAFALLELEIIHFPGEQKLPDFKPNFKIDSLPAYVICREVIELRWGAHSNMISNLHELLFDLLARKRKLH